MNILMSVAMTMLFFVSIAPAQNSSIPDTLWVQGSSCIFYTDPTKFSLFSVPKSFFHLLRSESYYETLLDSNYDLASASALFSVPQKKRPQDALHITAVHDSLFFLFWEDFQILASIPLTSSKGDCQNTPHILSHTTKWWGPKRGLSLGGQFLVPMIKKDEDRWWIYTPARLEADETGAFREAQAPPFLIFEIKHRGSHWRFKRASCRVPPISLSKPVRERCDIFGHSSLAYSAKGLWWADPFRPVVYLLDERGHKIDSLQMQSGDVNENFHFDYDPSKTLQANTFMVKSKVNVYSGLFASEEFLVRFVWIGTSSLWKAIIHCFESNKTLQIELPRVADTPGFFDNCISLGSVRAGDRIGFPFLSIAKLIVLEE